MLENFLRPEFAPIGTLGAAIAGLFAALAAWRAVRNARAALRMQIILDFSKRDASPELGAATQILWEFKQESNEDIAERFLRLRNEDPKRWQEMNNARRIVHKFWLQLMHIKQVGLITDAEILTCFYKHQFEMVLTILEPIEQKMPGQPYTKPAFDEYRRLYDQYDQLYRQVHRRCGARRLM